MRALGAVLAALVLASLAAPVWADEVAHSGPLTNHLTDRVEVDGRERDVVSPEGKPIGPTWQGRFFLGADANGRDVMVRLLYGARTSILIGVGAALLTTLLGTVAGLAAGYLRGVTDAVVSRALDLLWAFPVVLLGIALGTALALGGLAIGPVELSGDSKLIPLLIIALVYVPYVARPVRAAALSLRESEFVLAARVAGASPLRIMRSELLPNVASTVVVLFPLTVANAVLLEAALSFLGAGVRAPEPSLGVMVAEGADRVASTPHLAIAPGLALVACVLCLNVLGERLRGGLDPRARAALGT